MVSGSWPALRTRLLKGWMLERGCFNSAAALLSVLLVVSAYSSFPNIHVFGHDEVHYNTYYKLKLLQDARWLNYLLRDLLAGVDASAWFLVYIVSHLLLMYRLARIAGVSVAVSFLVAAVVTVSPPVVEQGLWPATAFPAIAILIVAGTFVQKGLAPWLTYLVLGVLLFGTMQNYYFLAPLLFLRQLFPENCSGKVVWRTVARHIGWWVLGALVGTLAMSFALLFLAGNFGPEIGEWRQPHPVKDLATLLQNLIYVSNSWWSSVLAIYAASKVNGMILMLFLGGLLAVSFGSLRAYTPVLFMLAMVAFSFHAFSLPLSPIILMRSLIAIVVAGVLLLALVSRLGALASMLVSLLLFSVGLGFQAEGRFFLNKQVESVGFIYEKLEQLLPAPAANYSSISIDGRMQSRSPVASAFNNGYLMASVVKAIGGRSYLDCRGGSGDGCSVPEGARVDSSVSVEAGRLDLYVLDNKRVIVRFSSE